MTIDTYTSGSGTHTVAASGTLEIELNGAGGGSGCGDGGGAGDGGAGGAYLKKTLTVTAGDTFTYSIGVGGTGVSYGVGGVAGSGTATTVSGGTYTANGGAGGDSQDAGGTASGGTASGGDINTPGSDGGPNAGNTGGTGGASPNGGASRAGSASTTPGVAGNAPGGGAGGAGKNDSGANGANGQAKFTLTPFATTLESEILRPIAGLEEFAGDTNWQNIDDVVTQPTTPGDMSYFTQPSGGGGSLQKIKVAAPTPGYTIIGAKLWILVHADFYIPGTTEFKIFSIRIKLNGTWYDIGSVDVLITTTPTWYSFELTELSESSNSSDIGFEWILTDIWGTYAGQDAKVDVAYLELTYPPLEQSSGFFHWF